MEGGSVDEETTADLARWSAGELTMAEYIARCHERFAAELAAAVSA